MKIVFLAPFGIRPKGTVIARMIPLAVELQALGHEVVIVSPPYTNPEDSGKTEVVRGIRLRNIALGPKHKVLAAPILAWRMFRAALSERPDLVHLFKPKGYGGLAAMLLILLQRVGFRLPPLFLDTDDWEGTGGMNELHAYSSLEKRFYRFQEQWLTRRAAGVTVASRALQAMVGAMGVAGERVLYLPNCAGAAQRGDGSGVRQRLGIGAETPVLLLYTRFFEFSQEKLHRVFGEIHRRVPGVRFLVVGRGRNNEEAELLAAARAGGFSDTLVMAGWVEPAELPDYLAAGDVAIYPFADTLVNRCKCPAKLTELLLAGVPVVADRIGQVTEYIDPELSTLLCDPDDWQAMAERAALLLLDPDRRRALGESGCRYLLEHFSWRRFVERLAGFYLKT
jgi:glycosyltransferase involved in cell wall biosynthesis